MVVISVLFLIAFGGSFVGSVVGVVIALVVLGESVGVSDETQEEQEVGESIDSCGTDETIAESIDDQIVDSWCYQDPDQGMMMKYRISNRARLRDNGQR